jgi:hypothetical protein
MEQYQPEQQYQPQPQYQPPQVQQPQYQPPPPQFQQPQQPLQYQQPQQPQQPQQYQQPEPQRPQSNYPRDDFDSLPIEEEEDEPISLIDDGEESAEEWEDDIRQGELPGDEPVESGKPQEDPDADLPGEVSEGEEWPQLGEESDDDFEPEISFEQENENESELEPEIPAPELGEFDDSGELEPEIPSLELGDSEEDLEPEIPSLELGDSEDDDELEPEIPSLELGEEPVFGDEESERFDEPVMSPEIPPPGMDEASAGFPQDEEPFSFGPEPVQTESDTGDAKNETESAPSERPGAPEQSAESAKTEQAEPKEKNALDKDSIVGLMNYLKGLAGDLPDKRRENFMQSDVRLSMEFVINTLSGKQGLLKELKQKEPERRSKDRRSALPTGKDRRNPHPDREKVAGTLSYLGNLSAEIPDKNLFVALRQKVQNIMTRIKKVTDKRENNA